MGEILRDFCHDLIMAGYSLIPRPSEGVGGRPGDEARQDFSYVVFPWSVYIKFYMTSAMI